MNIIKGIKPKKQKMKADQDQEHGNVMQTDR